MRGPIKEGGPERLLHLHPIRSITAHMTEQKQNGLVKKFCFADAVKARRVFFTLLLKLNLVNLKKKFQEKFTTKRSVRSSV